MDGDRRRWARHFTALRAILIALYPDKADVQRVADDAAVQLSRVNLDGASERVWHDVLQEAWKQHALLALIAVARAEFPANTFLARTAEVFARAPEFPISPVIDEVERHKLRRYLPRITVLVVAGVAVNVIGFWLVGAFRHSFIGGIVLHRHTGRGIADVEMILHDTTCRNVTDSDGVFVFRGCDPEGIASLKTPIIDLRLPGRITWCRAIRLRAPDEISKIVIDESCNGKSTIAAENEALPLRHPAPMALVRMERIAPNTGPGPMQAELLIDVANTRPDGSNWDSLRSPPDIAVCISGTGFKRCYTGGKDQDGFDLPICPDSFQCRFENITVPGNDFGIEVLDLDVAVHDLIGRGQCSVGQTCKIGQAHVAVRARGAAPR